MIEAKAPQGACVLLFTKPPRPGRVKTRLIGELSAEEAAELHAAFLGDVGESLSQGRFELRIAWALDEGEPQPTEETILVGAMVPSVVAAKAGFRQQGEDLGERLYHGLRRAADRFEMLAAVGSDSPELRADTVEDAFARLAAGADVALGPTRDGGYYLIALRRQSVRRELFEGIAWSTESVLEQTHQRCRELGLKVELLPVVDDVDVEEDLHGLSCRLTAGGEGSPRTRALLTAWGRLPAAVAEGMPR